MTLGACVGSEYIQNLVNPARIFDFVDIIYNVLGSLLALTLCVWFQSWKRRPSSRPDLLEPSPPSEDEIDGFVNVRMSDMPV
ncbi:VanZ like family protein [Clavispora lusitaniae]|nr:VanZ like family protein [Clavispora lusitaniae]